MIRSSYSLLSRIYHVQTSKFYATLSASTIDETFEALLRDVDLKDPLYIPSASHEVMVLHPKIRWGSSSPSILKNPSDQLDEAVSLVNTLPGFRVVHSEIIGVDYNTKRKAIWGTGTIEGLLRKKQDIRASALMVNVDMLSAMQQVELADIFKVPIYDRYNIVLSIFKHYAKTEESKLQIQLAEIPYIRHRLHYMNKSVAKSSVLHVEEVELFRGVDRFEVLRLREQSIKKKLRDLSKEENKEIKRSASDAGLVAIVGYTNCGKTTLVKRLTGSNSLNPKDRLFATLDTTRHNALLPSGRKVAFADTIGFFSELPTHLISAFEATLAHVKEADVIIHLRDISNAAWEAQSEDVLNTLLSLGIPEEKLINMITVDNKIDRDGAANTEGSYRISCTSGSGIEELIDTIDKSIMIALGCKIRRLKLLPSSPTIPYLYNEGFVSKEPKIDGPFLVFEVSMTEAEMSRMKKHVGSLVRAN